MILVFKNVFVLTLGLLLLACGSETATSENNKNTKPENCKYGSPTPIFSSGLAKVNEHFFSVDGQKGVEKVKFENGVDLELLQGGCNELVQSYQFSFGQEVDGDNKFWITQAIEQFRYLSTLSENHISFKLWADAIENASAMISIGEAFEPEPNTFIKIDKIPSGEKTILIVTFEAKN